MSNPQRPASNRYLGLTLLALPFLGAGVGFAIWMGSVLLTWHSAQSWAEVPAHILRAELKVHPGNKGTTYEVIAEYAYEYQGKKYTGHDIGLYGDDSNNIDFSFNPQDVYRELSESQKKKKPFRCYVNSVRPEQALLYRDLSCWATLSFQMYFVLFGCCAGFGLLVTAVSGIQKGWSRAALAKIHPETPWMWQTDWAAGQIVYSGKKKIVFSVLAATFWNLVSLPLTLLVLPDEILRKGNYTACFGLLFPAIGLGLIIWAIVSILRWRKFGSSIFRMSSVPGVIGGQLAGVIQTSVKIQPANGFHLTLSCFRRIINTQQKNKLWQETQTVAHELLNDTAEISAIPVELQIPSDCQPTNDTNTNDETFWRLKVAAKVHGLGYSATFEVPVFKMPESC